MAGQSRTISVGEEPLGEDRCGPVPIHAPTPSEAATVALRRFMMAPLQMVRVVRQVPETLVFIELGVAVGIVLVASSPW